MVKLISSKNKSLSYMHKIIKKIEFVNILQYDEIYINCNNIYI